ncbi:carbohydrate-binding module family 21 protein [Athelia psychrophila]|uniref:Carbohydrate-binding module family 21 protein n=1 Tax=Athelia psychrophila TaxID=1759441 RepID=A0A166SDC2_9AGAM|nr:carbohydrate-binding module family 21 protein [Fibularhizoctonia sp. CBS 109695]
MPYQPPAPSPTSPGRARNHRRSASFTDEKGPGAFVSLGSLPKVQRKPKSPTFHFRNDDDDDSPEDEPAVPPLVVNTAPVPFPMSSPPGSGTSTPTLTADSPPGSQRPTMSRGSSAGVLLSNGKPLKSSLKSSASAPILPPDVRSMHFRAASAPSTPGGTPKNVHFPEKREDGLEDVRMFSRKARPASVSLPPGMGLGDETETETEQESSARFPFPRFTAQQTASTSALGRGQRFEIDRATPGATSPIPASHPPGHANVHIESMMLAQPPTSASSATPAPPQLTGTVLVRNIAYEKHVAVRFTLDDWQTTSEVRASYQASLHALPWHSKPQTLGDAVSAIAGGGSAGAWDRFGFTIRLEDHAYKLHERVMWVVGKYGTGNGQEWWDNNNGSNYRVAFKAIEEPKPKAPDPVPTSKKTLNSTDFGLGFEFLSTENSPRVTVSASSFTPPPTSPSFNTFPSYTTTSSSGSSASSFTGSSRPLVTSPANSFTERRGHGLNLLNYAAPGSSKQSSPSTTPTGVTLPTLRTNFTSPPANEPPSPLYPPKMPRSPMDSPSLATAGSNSNPFFAAKKRGSPPRSPTKDGRKAEGTVPGWNWSAPSASVLAQRALATGAADDDSPAGTPTGSTSANTTSNAVAHGKQGQGLHSAWGTTPRALAGYHSPMRRVSPPGSGATTPGAPQPPVLSPLSPPIPRPFSPTSVGSPTNAFGNLAGAMGGGGSVGGGDSSEDMYQAFVKQWCFAQTPSVGPAAAGPAAGMAGIGAAAEVLVG